MRSGALAGAFVASCVAVVWPGPAAALDMLDRRIPKAELRTGDQVRALKHWSSTWIYRRGEHCVDATSDGAPGFKPELRTSRHLARPKLVVHKPQRPELRIAGYRRLAEGLPAGPERHYRSRLRPRVRAGEITAWVARPRIRVADQLYVIVSAAWVDQSGCFPTEIEESVAWSFALRRARHISR